MLSRVQLSKTRVLPKFVESQSPPPEQIHSNSSTKRTPRKHIHFIPSNESFSPLYRSFQVTRVVGLCHNFQKWFSGRVFVVGEKGGFLGVGGASSTVQISNAYSWRRFVGHCWTLSGVP